MPIPEHEMRAWELYRDYRAANTPIARMAIHEQADRLAADVANTSSWDGHTASEWIHGLLGSTDDSEGRFMVNVRRVFDWQ